jgi:hypothetical protein
VNFSLWNIFILLSRGAFQHFEIPPAGYIDLKNIFIPLKIAQIQAFKSNEKKFLPTQKTTLIKSEKLIENQASIYSLFSLLEHA